MNNLGEKIYGHRSNPIAFENRIINSNNFSPSEVEDYLVNFTNKDFRPTNSNNIVDQGNTTYTNGNFAPSGINALTKDIGALNYNSTAWIPGINWNNTNSTDENYVSLYRFNSYASIIGDPHIITFSGKVFKYDEEGFIRMYDNNDDNYRVIING